MAFSLATFNVKDLFDAPEPARRAQVEAKLAWLAAMLTRMDADVVGLQEVGSVSLLGELVGRLEGRGGYGEPVVGTADDRGIRNAILARVPVLASQVHAPKSLEFPVFQAGDPPPFGDRIPMRRGVVQATVDAGPLGQVHVLVAHFKSNRRLFERDRNGGAPPWVDVLPARVLAQAELRSLVWRASEALFVRGLVDDLVLEDPSAQVAFMGDLNDRPGSLVTRFVAGMGPGELFSGADLVREERRFSILHKGKPDLFDYVFVTQNLRQRAIEGRLFNEALRDHGDIPQGTEPDLVADSDHAPLVVRFG
jgi:endonuclease/exonuclease/phosphatase family metal-dependent hydrolase